MLSYARAIRGFSDNSDFYFICLPTAAVSVMLFQCN